MENIEIKCRKLAKEKDRKIIFRKVNNKIIVYYTVTIRRQSKTCENWQEVLELVEKL